MLRIILVAVMAGLIIFTRSASAGITINISYSENLKRAIPAIDRSEIQSEITFRKYRTYVYPPKVSKLADYDINWANEMLIPEISEFSTSNLLTAIVRKNMEFAGLNDLAGSISIKINRLKICDHSVAILRGSNTFVMGSINYLDSGGRVRSQPVTVSSLIIKKIFSKSFQGSDLAYFETDEYRRIGPALAYFVYKALKKTFPEKEFVKPLTISM